MKPLENIPVNANSISINSQTIEQKLDEAIKDFEDGRILKEEVIWKSLREKYGFDL